MGGGSATAAKGAAVELLSIESDGDWLAVIVSLSVAASAVSALLQFRRVPFRSTEPASRSAWVTVWLAVQVVWPAGARLPAGQPGAASTLSSVTVSGPAKIGRASCRERV